MKVVRSALAVVVALSGVVAAGWQLVAPLRANIERQRLEAATLRAWSAREYESIELARRNLLRLNRLPWRDDVSLLMTYAANQRILKQTARALEAYDAALRLDRRPELYLQRGLTLIEAARYAEAVPDLVSANLFYPNALDEITEPSSALAVSSVISLREERARTRLRRPLKLIPSSTGNLLGPSTFRPGTFEGPSTEASGAGNIGNAAAEGWKVWSSNAGGSVTTAMLPSTRSPGRNMLRVVTTSPSSGIWNFWMPESTGPQRARTSAWVYVVRGRVMIGSGNAGSTSGDAFSAGTGAWERVEATNTSCPVNATIIYSDTAGGAEFFIDEVSVTELPGERCSGEAGDPAVAAGRATTTTLNAMSVALITYRIAHYEFPAEGRLEGSVDELRAFDPDVSLVDGWGTPLRYERIPAGFRLSSAGPDRRFSAAGESGSDDVIVENGVPAQPPPTAAR